MSIEGLLVIVVIAWFWMGCPIGFPGSNVFRLKDLWSPRDSREPLMRDENGEVIALCVEGWLGNLPQHEDFIHDGIPHRNPLVTNSFKLRFGTIPWIYQTRLYPFTESGVTPNLEEIENRTTGVKGVYLTLLDRSEERRVEKVEDRDQRAKGVTRMIRH